MNRTQIKIDKIIRSKRKSIALVVGLDARLVVRAPMRISLEYIEDLVGRKSSWINKKRNWVLKNGGPAKTKKFVDGEDFLYLGENYKLKIEPRENIELVGNLHFPEKYAISGRVKIIDWYRHEAKEIISARAKLYSRQTGWKFRSLSITGAETRWGSCGANGSLNFTWKLIMAPLEVVDYVVVHELAHLVERNHSSKFWDKVKMVLPDYKSRRKWLSENRLKFKI